MKNLDSKEDGQSVEGLKCERERTSLRRFHTSTLQRFTQRLVALTLLFLSSLGGQAAEVREFLLNGTSQALSEAPPNVQVIFRGMRFNELSTTWNVDVIVTNAGTETYSGLIVIAVDGFAETTGPVRTDGVSVGSPSSPFFQLQLPSSNTDGEFRPGRATQPRTIALGFLDGHGAPRLTTKVFVQPLGQAFALAFTRSLNELGQPLPDVQVTETGPQGVRTLLTDSEYGVVTLGQGAGEHVWRFDFPGRLPVWRNGSVPLGNVRLIPNPRLALRNANVVSITNGVVSQLQDSATNIQINIPPGAFAANSTGTLTHVDGQTLPGLLAQGWSPLNAFWLELNAEPTQPIVAVLRPASAIGTNETAVLAGWDTNQLQWVATRTVVGNGTNPVTVTLSGSGAYALVVPDIGVIAPPAVNLRQPLPRSTTAWPSVTKLTASGTVNPSSSKPSQVGEEVTAMASLRVLSSSTPAPSGLTLRCDVREDYQLLDGSSRFTPQYENFLACYQRPGDVDLRTLHAMFPIRPLLLFGSGDLAQAKVTVDILPLTGFTGGIFDAAGNFLELGGIRLSAKPGAFDRQQAALIRPLDPSNFTSLLSQLASGLFIQSAFDLTVAATASDQTLSLQLSNLPPSQNFVLARLISDTRFFGLEPIERLRSDTNGTLNTLEPLAGERLSGISGAGQFVLIGLTNTQGLLRGLARDSGGQPKRNVPVRIDGQPWLTFSDMNGSYRLLAPIGEGTLTVLDLGGGSISVSSFAMTNAATGMSFDVSTAPGGPRVGRITPADRATNVSRITQVSVEFTKPVNPGTLIAGGLQLLDQGGQLVVGAVSLNLANTVATLLPDEQLASSTSYTVVVSTNVTDQGGRSLEGPNTTQFTTQRAPVDRTGSSLISFEPVNGQAALIGTAGTAEGDSPVILVNETTGRTTTVLSRADGSFSNSIPADVDDTLRAVIVNHNGTRNTVAVNRQIFADGSIGLFSSGGTLDVTNENGTAQFIVEPGAIDQKTIFKVEAVSLARTRELLGNVEPTNGAVLGGFKFAGLRGSPLRQALEVNVPINRTELPLPAGANPTNATFGLAIARVMDGEQVFELVDSMHYEDGRLVTHSPPFAGPMDIPSDVLLLPILLSPNPPIVAHGRVYSAIVDGNGQETNAKDLAGAIVRSADPIGGINPAKLAPGMVFTVSSTDGRYTLLAIKPTLSATHPWFPRWITDVKVPPPPVSPPVPGATQTAPISQVDLRFSIPPSGGGLPPQITVTHLPQRQDPGKTINLRIVARCIAFDPVIDKPKVRSVIALAAGEVVSESEILIEEGPPELPIPFEPHVLIQSYLVSSPKAVIVDLLLSANDGFGHATTMPYTLQFGGQVSDSAPGPIPGSDFHDTTGPRVLWSIPEMKGTLRAGSPITIKFDEPIKTNVLQQSAAVLTINPSCKEPLMSLSDDQTVLTVTYFDLHPATTYTLTVKSAEDLSGNVLDQESRQSGVQPFSLIFTPGSLPSGELSDPNAPNNYGVGAVVSGHHAFILERSPTTNSLLVYDLSDPQTPKRVAVKPVSFFPRDLVLIPQYSFYFAPPLPQIYTNQALRKQVTVSSFSEIVTRDLIAVVGGIPGQSSVLRIYDINDPTRPELVAGTILSQGGTLASRVHWSAPLLTVLEVGERDVITTVNLQSYLVGSLLFENAEEYKKLGQGRPGHDDNLDGDYVDDGEEFPLPPSTPFGFPGKEDSFGIADSTQAIRDFAIEEQGAFRGAIVLPGLRLNENGEMPCPVNNLDPCKVPAGFRTLLNGGLPVFLDEPLYPIVSGGFYPILNGSPRRLFTMFKHIITAGTNTTYYDLALISVNSAPNEQTNHVLVLNLTNRLKPSLLFDIPIPRSAGTTNLYSIVQRKDGMLVLASDTNSFLLDPAKFGAAIVDTNRAREIVAGMIPGIGGDGWTFGVSDSGVIVSGRVPTRPGFVVTPPVIEIVSFPGVDPFLPEAWLQDLQNLSPDTAASDILDRLSEREIATSLRLARFKAEDGYCPSTLKNITATGARSVHYYALVKFPGGDPGQHYIELALESLNWAGAPLKKRGFLFPPVHGFSAPALDQQHLDQAQGPEDAPARSCKARRLSDDPGSPLFDLYLSRPFALVAESLSKQELMELNQTLERDILWSGNFLRISIDPSEAQKPLRKPFAGEIVDGRYHPPVFTTLPSLPGDFIQSANPMPIRGGATIALTGGFVGAHNSELLVDTVDLAIPGRRLPVAFGRHYSGQALHHGPFGRGWDYNYNLRLVELSPDLIVPGYTNPVVIRSQVTGSEYATNRDVLFYNGAGRTFVYSRAGTNPPPQEIASDPLIKEDPQVMDNLKWVRANGEAATNIAEFYLPPSGVFSPLVKFKDGRFATLDPDGTRRWFNAAGRLIKIYDRFENSIELSYGDEGELISIRSDGGQPNDRFHLDVGYFRSPNSSPWLGLDIVTNRPAFVGRICKLKDYTGREVFFGYKEDGDLEVRRGVKVTTTASTVIAAPGPAAPGPQITRYLYSDSSDPAKTRKSLQEIRGPNRETYVGGVEKTLKVEEFASSAKGPDMVHSLYLGDKLLVTVDQQHENTAKNLSAAPGKTEAKGPLAGSIQTIITYEFDPQVDPQGRPKTTKVSGGPQDLITGSTYYPNGLLKQITFPEGNSLTYTYSDLKDSLRSRANLTEMQKDPGPRGHASSVSATTPDYNPLYNLPTGDQFDYRGKKTTIALSPDSRWIQSIKKGVEEQTFNYDQNGMIQNSTDASGFTTVFQYTPEGFLEFQTVEDSISVSTLITHYTYGSSPSALRGLPLSVIDPMNVATEFQYDELDRLIKRTRADSVETLAYDSAGNTTNHTSVVEAGNPNVDPPILPRLRVEHFHYDDFGHLLSNVVDGVEVADLTSNPIESKPKSIGTQYELDKYYRVVTATAPSGEQKKMDYDRAGRVVKTWVVANSNNFYEQQFHYDKNGNVTRTEFDKRITTILCDGYDRPFENNSPTGAKTTFTYDANDNLLTQKTTDTQNNVLYDLSPDAEYDDLDRPTSITRQTEAGASKTEFHYNAASRTTMVKDSRQATTTHTYESLGRKWSLDAGLLGTMETSFDPLGHRLTQTFQDQLPEAAKTTTHFTDLGHTDWIEDTESKRYEFTRGVDGRVLQSRLPTSPSPFTTTHALDGLPLRSSRPGGASLVAEYDARRNPIREAPRLPNGSVKGTTYSHDEVGRAKAVFDALSHKDEVDTFNSYGQPLVVNLARGIQRTFTYDDFGRVTAIDHSMASATLNAHYTWGYDVLNRVTNASNANGSLNITYGKEGLPKTVAITQFGTTYTLEQEFDTEGARTSLTYPVGFKVGFGRDNVGRLTVVQPPVGDPVIQNSIYDAGPLVTERTMGNDLITLIIGYDANRREIRRTYKVGGQIVAEVAYERNDAGLITKKQLTQASTTDYFNYDDSQRLKRAVIGATATLTDPPPPPGVVPPGAYERTFDYDSSDVLTGSAIQKPAMVSVPNFVGSVGTPDDNLFVTAATYLGPTPISAPRTPDEAGNTTRSGAFARPRVPDSSQMTPGDAFKPVNTQYTYNELDQLTVVRRDDGVNITNVYGPNGLRIRRTVQGPGDLSVSVNSDLEYIYDGANLIEIRDATHNRELRARFYYGDNGDELLAGDFFDVGSNTPKRHYYLTDSFGSPMAIVNAAGAVVEYYMYDTWGEATIRPPGVGLKPSDIGIHTRSAIGSPFYFQGQVYDEDAGLIYMRARFYDPALGVFLQRDPSGYEDSGNQYAGLGNNPVSYRDPTGRGIFDEVRSAFQRERQFVEQEGIGTYLGREALLGVVRGVRGALNSTLGMGLGRESVSADADQAEVLYRQGQYDRALAVAAGFVDYHDIHLESKKIGSTAVEQIAVMGGHAAGINHLLEAKSGESRTGHTLRPFERVTRGFEGGFRLANTAMLAQGLVKTGAGSIERALTIDFGEAIEEGFRKGAMSPVGQASSRRPYVSPAVTSVQIPTNPFEGARVGGRRVYGPFYRTSGDYEAMISSKTLGGRGVTYEGQRASPAALAYTKDAGPVFNAPPETLLRFFTYAKPSVGAGGVTGYWGAEGGFRMLGTILGEDAVFIEILLPMIK